MPVDKLNSDRLQQAQTGLRLVSTGTNLTRTGSNDNCLQILYLFGYKTGFCSFKITTNMKISLVEISYKMGSSLSNLFPKI